MPKRTLAALAALLTFATVLAVVPLATAEPAQAHNCVETYGSNAYTYGSAPGANNGHGHYCGIRKPTTTTPTTTTAPPTTTTTPPIVPRCDAGKHIHSYRGTWCHANHTKANNDCRLHRADGTHIANPCTTTTTVACTAGHHHSGTGCHTHGFTPPADQCGTGKTWAPHAGHTPIRLPACKTTATADPCGDYADDLIAALNKVNDGTNAAFDPPPRPTQCQGPSTTDAAGKLRAALERLVNFIGESHGEAADGERQAYEQLRAEINKILGNQYVQAVTGDITCTVLIAALIKSKGKIAQRPGWVKAAAGGTAGGACAAAVVYIQNLLEKEVVPGFLPGVGNKPAGDQDGDGTDDSEASDDSDDAPKVPTKQQMVEKNAEIQKKKDAGTLTPEERAEWKEMHRLYTCATSPTVANTDWCKS